MECGVFKVRHLFYKKDMQENAPINHCCGCHPLVPCTFLGIVFCQALMPASSLDKFTLDFSWQSCYSHYSAH
jgi:hypothetical protein